MFKVSIVIFMLMVSCAPPSEEDDSTGDWVVGKGHEVYWSTWERIIANPDTVFYVKPK